VGAAAAGQNVEPARAAHHLACEPRLADPRRAEEADGIDRRACLRLAQCRTERSQLRLAADERRVEQAADRRLLGRDVDQAERCDRLRPAGDVDLPERLDRRPGADEPLRQRPDDDLAGRGDPL
jgi:hypothetical protein